MDFVINNVKSFLAAVIHIRMYGTLVSTYIGESGYIGRIFKYGKYTLFIYNNGGGLGMKFSIIGGENKAAYRYYAVTDRDYIRILGLPDNKFEIEKY